MPYDRTVVVTYARKWALSTNTTYGRYPNDCTNFVSQCLYNGGMTMVGDKSWSSRKDDNVWWFDFDAWTERWRSSYTWAGAQNLYNFLDASSRGIRKSSALELNIGDVIQMKNDEGVHHSMVVTAKQDSDLLLCYHTNDTLDKPLSEVQKLYPTEVYIYWMIDGSKF